VHVAPQARTRLFHSQTRFLFAFAALSRVGFAVLGEKATVKRR